MLKKKLLLRLEEKEKVPTLFTKSSSSFGVFPSKRKSGSTQFDPLGSTDNFISRENLMVLQRTSCDKTNNNV